MNSQDYIEERMKFLAQNIEDFSIGQNIVDYDNSVCKITNKTKNTIEVALHKKNENGINCRQWFDMKSFNVRFKFFNSK